MSLVILYGTESGNSELVADDLSDALDGESVTTLDMSDVDPADLDRGSLHLVICSTYGDGELPGGAEPFFEALESQQPDLTGLRYAVFGLGDRSYHETYSHGSEIIDRALAARGATRVGDYGRHDASGRESATAVALQWLDTLRAAELV